MTIIPHFGKLSQEQTEQLLQQLMEYVSLHDSLDRMIQDAFLEHIHGSLCIPPQETLSQDANEMYNFFKERINNSCLIIQDLILRRCREAMKNAELQCNEE